MTVHEYGRDDGGVAVLIVGDMTGRWARAKASAELPSIRWRPAEGGAYQIALALDGPDLGKDPMATLRLVQRHFMGAMKLGPRQIRVAEYHWREALPGVVDGQEMTPSATIVVIPDQAAQVRPSRAELRRRADAATGARSGLVGERGPRRGR